MKKIIKIYNHQLNNKYGFKTDHTYFDCTNFYFEIDKEDDFRRKGPSKEKRVVTYNPKLAEKQIYEINKQVEKTKQLKASQAKK